jgi:hypothetical protein
MRVLLDENLPELLVVALRGLGHEVDSVNGLKLKGLDNGTLYRQMARDYDICFTKDVGFVRNVRGTPGQTRVKLLRVVLPQTPAKSFVAEFILAFQNADWTRYTNGDDGHKIGRIASPAVA